MIWNVVMAAVGKTGKDRDPAYDGRNKVTQGDLYVCVSFRENACNSIRGLWVAVED